MYAHALIDLKGGRAFVPERGDAFILLRTIFGGISKPTRQLTAKCLGIQVRGGTGEGDRGADEERPNKSKGQR